MVKSAPINELPVEEPAPKKKVVVVHKKNALADSWLLPEDVAQKVYEPLNPECTIKLCEFLVNFWTLEKSEYLEKGRIIENTVFIVSFEIKLMENEKLFRKSGILTTWQMTSSLRQLMNK